MARSKENTVRSKEHTGRSKGNMGRSKENMTRSKENMAMGQREWVAADQRVSARIDTDQCVAVPVVFCGILRYPVLFCGCRYHLIIIIMMITIKRCCNAVVRLL